jgi:small subunit ribosomal protein S6
MREYELIYIIQPDASDEREQEIHARIDGAIQGGQGLVLLRDDWGRRKLAHEIDKFQKGHYFQLNFLGDGKFIQEMERLMRIDPDLLRFLTVQCNENVVDIDARVAEAKDEAEERAKRREEREKLEAEREEAAAARDARPSNAPEGDRAPVAASAPAAEPAVVAEPAPVGDPTPAGDSPKKEE